jgi:hypothetical protein
MMSSSRRLFVSVLLAGLGTGLVACKKKEDSGASPSSSSAAISKPIVIGHYASMTGSTAHFGQDTDKAVRLAVDEINRAGGVNGRKIEVVTLDDRGDSAEASNAVARLIDVEKASAIIGEVASSLSLSGGRVAQRRKIPMVSPSSTNPKVTEVGDYIFRVCFLDPFQGKVMANFARNTLKLDATRLAAALKSGATIALHTELCRKQAGSFQAALGDPEVLVACTQEAPLFSELAAAAGSKAELRFVNIRETAGWSAQGSQATPKIAALIAAAALPEPAPVPSVEYKSGGELLVIGPSAAALDWAQRLADALQPSVLITRREGGELPSQRGNPVWSGRARKLSGWLGAFEDEREQDNPKDQEQCTRCNACDEA